jgi:hypothetical protein
MNRAPRVGDDQIRWQRLAAALLGKLLELRAREGLQPIAWTVQSAGANLTGQMLSHPYARRREHHGGWKAATTSASSSPPDHDHQHPFGGAPRETRLVTSSLHATRLVAAVEQIATDDETRRTSHTRQEEGSVR